MPPLTVTGTGTLNDFKTALTNFDDDWYGGYYINVEVYTRTEGESIVYIWSMSALAPE